MAWDSWLCGRKSGKTKDLRSVEERSSRASERNRRRTALLPGLTDCLDYTVDLFLEFEEDLGDFLQRARVLDQQKDELAGLARDLGTSAEHLPEGDIDEEVEDLRGGCAVEEPGKGAGESAVLDCGDEEAEELRNTPPLNFVLDRVVDLT